jgi:DNA modification methylase
MENTQTIKDFENKIICGDCIDVMKKIPDESIDLVVTSPPYDKIRNYKKNEWTIDLPEIGKQISRILKPNAVCVMVIQDQTIDFVKTCTSFRTIINWVDNTDLNLFECNLYYRSAQPGIWWNPRFRVDHEYMPIFVKGNKPQYFNKEHLKIPATYGGQENCWGKKHKVRKTENDFYEEDKVVNPKLKCRGTVWDYTRFRSLENMNKSSKRKHPAVFCDQFALDIIPTFTTEGMIVLDPMVGSGTIPVAAKKLNRKYIGIDVYDEYCKIAEELLKQNNPSKEPGLFPEE